MSSFITIIGFSFIGLLLAGYYGRSYLPAPKPKVIGIDLGTTFSCVSVYHFVTGKVEVLENERNDRCVPSVVAFSPEGVLVGFEAQAYGTHHPSRVIYDAKRFIGKTFSLAELQLEAARFPYKMNLTDDGEVRFIININETTLLYSPEQIGSFIISDLLRTTKRVLGFSPHSAVMSAPAEFDSTRRAATTQAATLAGINVLRVVSEPTAAALACGLHMRPGESILVVVDLGGGTLDVSVLLKQNGVFLTQAMAGNNHLGGGDFTERLFLYMENEIAQKLGLRELSENDRQRLRQVAELTKIDLSLHEERNVHFKVDGMLQDTIVRVTRMKFNEINEDLFESVLLPVRLALEDASLTADVVEHVVLVGGSVHVLRVRELLSKMFNREPLLCVDDPEEAVVIGTGIQAGILGGMWPVAVAAVELPTAARKIHVV